ncbi:MAG: succinylglutamate desuccinylase/aspartoacylase family protein [Oceanospirillum sp.]|nr:succinylglutamate desuccinylase/aspartoacylase family protein [Oceanospirillum sp.]
MKANPLEINGEVILPGQRRTLKIPVAAMVTNADVNLTIQIIHGKKPGPVLLVSAAIHGDEINGVEIIRRLLKQRQLSNLAGTLIVVPIVNIHGFVGHSRYLPDGRDLNRSFPGSQKGSLAGRLAHTFMTKVVCHATHGIDLHTGARHRANLPQIRFDPANETCTEMANAFGLPVILHSDSKEGTFRKAAADNGIPIILYEAGEALRFDEVCIRAGMNGIINVMRHLGMVRRVRRKKEAQETTVALNSIWVRSPTSGILRTLLPLGARTTKGSVIALVADPMGEFEVEVIAPCEGIVIGRVNLPLVHEGEALFHIARFREDASDIVDQVEAWNDELEPDTPMEPPEQPDIAPIIT